MGRRHGGVTLLMALGKQPVTLGASLWFPNYVILGTNMCNCPWWAEGNGAGSLLPVVQAGAQSCRLGWQPPVRVLSCCWGWGSPINGGSWELQLLPAHTWRAVTCRCIKSAILRQNG